MTFKTKTLSMEEAKAEGFADFNDNPHLCVELPDGQTTISVRTSEGKRLTIAFLPYIHGKAAQCADVCYHDSGMTTPFNGKDNTVQDMVLFGRGKEVFRTTGLPEEDKPLFATVLMHDKE
jgi:hypothetical protein